MNILDAQHRVQKGDLRPRRSDAEEDWDALVLAIHFECYPPPLQSSPASGSDDGTMRPKMVKGTAAAEQRELANPGVISIRGPRIWNSDRPSRFVDYSEKRAKTDKRGGRVGGEKRVFHKGNRLENMWMRNRQGGKSGKSSKKHGGWYYDECYDLPPKYDP